MKLENYIFFMFISAAAIVIGFTMGVAANFPFILEQSGVIASTSEATTTESLHTGEADNKNIFATASTKLAYSGNTSTDVLVITEQERTEIIGMLESLGLQAEDNCAEFIRKFQKNHDLKPTGALDSMTLNLIIEQSKFDKVNEKISY